MDVVNYFYQDGKVLYTTGSDANKAFNILGAGDNIIATEHQDTNGNATYSFYNKDLRGSTTNILGSDLTSKVSYDYDWFGNTEISNPQGSDFYNQICYTGGMYDESTKQYYLNARYYDPEDGRFISQDTYRGNLRDANSWNLYAYCANNPVKYSDPSGHFIWFAIGAAFAIYDGVKAYQKAKKQGKSGIKAVAAVAGGIAVGAVFGKVTKALTATKTVAKVAQKVFKSKTVKKLETKIANKIYTGVPKKLSTSSTKALKKQPASGITGGSATGAGNIATGAKLKEFYRQAEKYGTGSIKELESGKFRFYGDVKAAAKEGEMAGARLVREWDPATGATRTWYETVDHAGNIRQVRPNPNLTGGVKTHYMFDVDGNYTGSWIPRK